MLQIVWRSYQTSTTQVTSYAAIFVFSNLGGDDLTSQAEHFSQLEIIHRPSASNNLDCTREERMKNEFSVIQLLM